MRTLDQILTKKDYSRKTPASLFYKDSPLWQKLLTIGCVIFLAGAGLGEWHANWVWVSDWGWESGSQSTAQWAAFPKPSLWG